MRSKFTVVFFFILLFFTLQVASSAQLEISKFKGKFIFLEEPSNVRQYDVYCHAQDVDFWGREAWAFISTMNMLDSMPFFPQYEPKYQNRYYVIAQQPYFMADNNYVADSADLIYYVGHGNNFKIGMTSSSDYLWLPNVPGLGDRDLEFIIFQSCYVIPSPDDRADWYSPWWEHDGKGIFQGLHMACGFRTLEWAGDGLTASRFAFYLHHNYPVMQSWFIANQQVRQIRGAAAYPSLASVLFYPGLENDTLYTYGPDPPRDAHWLSIAWEEHI